MRITSGEVLSLKRYGEHYHGITIVSPYIGENVKPGQFVNIQCGDNRSSVLRRPFSIFRVHRQGSWASTLEIAFDIRGPGTAFLSQLRPHSIVSLVGPLGRGFALPRRRAHCLLVGGGVGAAPLFFLADELRNEGHRVDVALGARTSRLLLNAIEARRLASVCRITTDDGSTGERGLVTDGLEQMIERCAAEIIYACGPNPMLAAVSRIAVEKKIPIQVAVEELMACGFGVCMTCVLPVRQRSNARPRDSGTEVNYARSCTEGPVFNGASVVWDGSVDSVALDQAELSPAGVAVRESPQVFTEDEHAPPGN